MSAWIRVEDKKPCAESPVYWWSPQWGVTSGWYGRCHRMATRTSSNDFKYGSSDQNPPASENPTYWMPRQIPDPPVPPTAAELLDKAIKDARHARDTISCAPETCRRYISSVIDTLGDLRLHQSLQEKK